MARTRSPNYPAMNIADALEGVESIYRADKKNKMSRETVSRHIGYNSLNGRSIVKIGALKAYKLLEGAKDELRLTQSAVELVAETKGNQKWTKVAKEAAFSPEIFSELNGHYEGHKPSPENLRSELIKRDYTLEAVDRVVQIYLDNYEYVGGNFNFSHPEKEKSPTGRARDRSRQPLKREQKEPTFEPRDQKEKEEYAATNDITFSIENGRLRVSALVDKEGLEKLQKILSANKDFLEN